MAQVIAGTPWNPGTPLSPAQLNEINVAIINGNRGIYSTEAINQYYQQFKATPVNPPTVPVPNLNSTPTSRSDDTANPTQSRLVGSFDQKYRTVTPQPNVLDNYSSYTYNVSIYLLTAADYTDMITRQTPILKGSNLLMSTGGAPGGQRNQRFPLDFYLDDISIQQLQPGRGSRGANGVVSLNFKITEPNGITFLDNLYSAVDDVLGSTTDSSKKQNYSAQIYLMHIKFYGYDQNGKLMQAAVSGESNVVTDSRAVVEKFIPFRFVNITYRIASQLVEYSCQAVVPQNDIGTGQGRGAIPYNVELSASTLGEAFSGAATVAPPSDGRVSTSSPGTTTATAPSNANSSAGPGTVVSGIVEALNNYQRELTQPQGPNNESIYDEYDEFSVIFTDKILSDASTQPPGPTNKTQVSSQPPLTAAARLLGQKQSVNNDSKKISAVAGTTLVQFLDQVIRSSSFIYDQQVQGYDVDGKLIKLPGKDVGLLSWYRIGVQAIPKAYDRKRNDFAYKITYQISPYLINDPKSPYFPETKYRGAHKIYNYWFTGENTQVLSYQQDFNYSYYMVISGPQPNSDRKLANFREYEKRLYQPRSNESDQGQSSRVNEPSANLAERQYNAADLARAKMTIVGDPAWIHQGEVWRGISGVNFTLKPFFSDGTINVEVEEPLFLIAWNKPSDYNLNTGIIDPAGRTLGGGNQLTTQDNNATQTYVYRAITVTSTFGKGRFTQDIEGVLVTFPDFAIKYSKGGEVDVSLTRVDTQSVATPQESARVTSLTNGGSRLPQVRPQETSVTNGNQPSGDTITDPEAQTFAPSFNTPVSANPAGPPTSGSQVVGTATPINTVNSEANGISQSPATSSTFSLLELRRADPALATEFVQFRDQTADTIYAQELTRLTSLREQQSGPLTPLDRNRIQTFARSSADTLAESQAIAKYRPSLITLGTGVYSETPASTPASRTQATLPTAGVKTQIMNREY
jgi:hypothetical protein